MKYWRILLPLMLFWSLCACKDGVERKHTAPMSAQDAKPKPFFAYDAIDYYFSNISDSAVLEMSIVHEPIDPPVDSLQRDVVTGDVPRDVFDLKFLDSMASIGYRKKTVNPRLFPAIDSLFTVQPVDNLISTKCIYVYRDILIFKQKGKVVGTAKICFTCMAHEIRGVYGDTRSFGQNGGYQKLEELLHQ